MSSLLRGALGFTILGLAGFTPWALGLGRTLGEGGMYAVCAMLFVLLSGPLLHRLILGTGSLWRFYVLFGIAFLAYAAIWCALWFGVRFRYNDYAGLIAGSAAFGGIVAWSFGAADKAWKAMLAIAIFHAPGYWLGDRAYAWLGGMESLGVAGWTLDHPTCSLLGRLAWGLFYGLGFGAGIGLAFHLCQRVVRERLLGGSLTRS